MAYKVTKIGLFVLLLALLSDRTTAQSGCTTTLMGLSPCLNYVSGNSSSPSSSCCSQLSNVVQSQPQCLCLLLNGTASSYGFNINQTLAVGLPSVCNVQTPPVSRCNEGNGPTASPTTPESHPADSPSGSAHIPSGSKRVPSESGNNVGGSNMKAPSNVVAFLFLIASYTMFVAGF
ncbi:hypothetical protein CDL12_07841 [Handroanthus impetiginosus]|uniref:Bifunctional inhibitor/plant lipid transfer protein/seed storage helical domain-containing protein n=1 Tax=Handroanthus impetiginosus TaxID=429701 RepID=A0A2G9HQA4_9LAMI|nr:hypothetical protein CDL12_07841 [Handroanthus impetiginosus]